MSKTAGMPRLALGPLWAALSVTLLASCGEGDTRVIDVSQRASTHGRLTLEEFVAASTFHGPNGPEYVVEGDLPFQTLNDVEDYYYNHYARETDKLAVRQFNGADEIWPNGDQRALEYCVSTTFPATGTWSRTNTIAAMTAAAQRWKDVANIEFRYISSRDSDCLSGSSIPNNRFFKVAPKALPNAFACAFGPISRSTCSQLDGSTVGADTSKTPPLSITRTLTHELGHVLGMGHEYQRDDAPDTNCRLSGTSRNLTDYDNISIMQASAGGCGASPMENLSQLDGFGMRQVYGSPPAWISTFVTLI